MISRTIKLKYQNLFITEKSILYRKICLASTGEIDIS